MAPQFLLKPGMKVVAFDPGGTTGVAQGRYLGGESGTDFDLICATQIKWEDRGAVRRYVEGMDYVITERFALYEDKAKAQINNTFPSVRVIGLIEAAMEWSANQGLKELIEQPASERISVKILPQHEGALKGARHATDAYRHLRYFMVINGRPNKGLYLPLTPEQARAESDKQTSLHGYARAVREQQEQTTKIVERNFDAGTKDFILDV